MTEQSGQGQTLDNLLTESRTFPPSDEFAQQANAKAELYEQADADREAFWAAQAEQLTWETPWNQVLDWSNAPFAKWFVGGKLNVAYNCVDRHVEAGNGDRVAIHWEGEPGDGRTITYADLLREVSKTANALLSLGLTTGDRVAIYMPMLPEAIFSMLACARLGLTHSVVFGGFSAEALRSRIDDAQAKLVITADGQYRRGKPAPLKAAVDEAVAKTPSVEHVLVVKRTETDVEWTEGRDIWWHDTVDGQSEQHTPEAFDSEHPLYILYTSGTTGKPKGILHTTGGYLTQTAYTHRNVFDLKPESDVYWCTADIGWVTGHSYIVYGPLANGATEVVYEGTPNTPHEGRHWEIVQKYGVTIYYTAPTLIRTFMKWGKEIPEKFDLSSLRVLGSVGEPINPEAWIWYRETIGSSKTPVVDTWWQTETGAIMISPLPGVTHAKPGSAQRALPGISAKVVDDQGNEVAAGGGGYLVLDKPWPAMLRGIWGDEERYRDTYWSRFADQGFYFAGDGAKYDADGDVWLLGRVDDVMNVSGHRISTTEVESALVSHPTVAEAAVVGASDATTGQGIVAFVILRGGVAEDEARGEAAIKALRDHVAKEIGPIAKPRQIMVVPELPKTRSGKIMRRLLRDVAENREIGDVTTLADSSVMELISSGLKGSGSDE
ncbi:acetate--CoA ligase [Actinophytocola algeriensis]|uniref:Acetyl-coenzyme A synthetase n=1 Tax=Actinophytocola algeriensis TaxID=1768010 RepID=A0A7W7VEE7_9PSEU|nr:acetate--CoA ligase [Actinophytocola algeriensis]MBB4907167.1 acetyl-CoA synthetase [Actinophytocola algeriensis]MBE1478650.1 acetyl-CoA synthetase [Actinophytocola algeriensis]